MRGANATDAILRAAEQLFLEHGYRATAMRDVAAEAGVAIATVYARFEGKADLLAALAERLLAANEDALEEALRSGAKPLDRVLAAADAYLRFHLEHPAALHLIGLRDAAEAPRVRARLDRMADALAGAIRTAVEAGEARPVDPKTAARFVWGAWNGVVALRARGLLESDEELAATLTIGREIVAAGLRERPGAAAR